MDIINKVGNNFHTPIRRDHIVDTTSRRITRIGIVGSRSFTHIERLRSFLKELFLYDCEYERKTNIKRWSYEIVSGGGGTVDLFAEDFARAQGSPYKIFLPEKGPDGRWIHKGAGVARNRKIADYVDGLVAFYNCLDDYRHSGTMSTVKFTAELTKPVRIITGIEDRFDAHFLRR